eukprot:5135492-Lingulodinium_polyedra.AAC.1
MRRPPYGGRLMECAMCEMRGAATVERASERASEQDSRDACSETQSDVHSTIVAPHISQFARSMRRPPY